MFGFCFVIKHFVPFLVLQLFHCDRESSLLYFKVVEDSPAYVQKCFIF